ncbi:MAG: iron-containing redox enzyme family protein [Calditrichaeota bacterium]|nr:iron-containing redox enzyme family protein [Calditrichota bacterium]
MSLNNYVKEIAEYAEVCYKQIDAINSVLSGEISKENLRNIAKRHYAEIRTFLDIKIPERMRLCPPNAYSAKQYFWYLYREEQGFFKPGENHAELFLPACYALGLSDEELEKEYQAYWPHYKYMFNLTPSTDVFIRELAISTAWESFSPIVGPHLIKALKKYDIGDDGLKYFTLHYEVDQRHGNQAYKTLSDYVINTDLQSIAMDAISDSMLKNNYFDFKL